MSKKLTLEDLATMVQKEFAAQKVSTDDRFDKIEQRLDSIETRLDKIEKRLDKLESRFDDMEDRFDRVEYSIGNQIDKLRDDMMTVKTKLANK